MTNKERMSRIGEVMDELVKLGFMQRHHKNSFVCLDNDNAYYVDFHHNHVTCDNDDNYDYDSPTWQQDLLTRVKELKNHE